MKIEHSIKDRLSIKDRFSIKGQLLLVTVSVCLLQGGLLSLGLHVFAFGITAMQILLISGSCFVSLLLLVFLLNLFYKPVQKLISALETGVASFKDKDFSITIHNERNDELGRIVDA